MMKRRQTYRATAEKEGKWWVIKILDLPPELCGVTQSLIKDGWQTAEMTAREAVSLLLEIPDSSFDMELKKVEGDN